MLSMHSHNNKPTAHEPWTHKELALCGTMHKLRFLVFTTLRSYSSCRARATQAFKIGPKTYAGLKNIICPHKNFSAFTYDTPCRICPEEVDSLDWTNTGPQSCRNLSSDVTRPSWWNNRRHPSLHVWMYASGCSPCLKFIRKFVFVQAKRTPICELQPEVGRFSKFEPRYWSIVCAICLIWCYIELGLHLKRSWLSFLEDA